MIHDKKEEAMRKLLGVAAMQRRWEAEETRERLNAIATAIGLDIDELIDAEMLLDFALSSGKTVDASIIEAITRLHQFLEEEVTGDTTDHPSGSSTATAAKSSEDVMPPITDNERTVSGQT